MNVEYVSCSSTDARLFRNIPEWKVIYDSKVQREEFHWEFMES